jgi:hypothetical protein
MICCEHSVIRAYFGFARVSQASVATIMLTSPPRRVLPVTPAARASCGRSRTLPVQSHADERMSSVLTPARDRNDGISHHTPGTKSCKNPFLLPNRDHCPGISDIFSKIPISNAAISDDSPYSSCCGVVDIDETVTTDDSTWLSEYQASRALSSDVMTRVIINLMLAMHAGRGV